ncbi:abcB4 [Symbiodinium natans]|uniref:AbcB4 protein n=1 Tax=Symbiodinium natans TaxID=878477 RepID=A0A812M527_9DINO|nr:abcB4 [Symbiodinium natans]
MRGTWTSDPGLGSSSWSDTGRSDGPLRVTHVRVRALVFGKIVGGRRGSGLWGTWALANGTPAMHLHTYIPRVLAVETASSESTVTMVPSVEGKTTVQRIELTYSDGSLQLCRFRIGCFSGQWAMGPPLAGAKKQVKNKRKIDDGVKIMAPWAVSALKKPPLRQAALVLGAVGAPAPQVLQADSGGCGHEVTCDNFASASCLASSIFADSLPEVLSDDETWQSEEFITVAWLTFATVKLQLVLPTCDCQTAMVNELCNRGEVEGHDFGQKGEVKHEPLLQWWWVGAALELRTNKGRSLQACGTWSSGFEENTEVFTASPGCAVLGLRLHNGRCHGIIEGPAPEVDELELKLWAVYWLAEGSADDDIQSRNFVGRESAFSFAERVGGGHEMAWQCGPLKLSISDHPWLDCCRDLRELLQPARLAALEAREVASQNESYVEFATGERFAAGIVLDLVKTSRVKAWGPHARRKKCEELAAETRQSLKFSGSREEQGQFNLKRWRDMSVSFAEIVHRIQSVKPTLARLVAMMDLRRHLFRTLFTAAIAAVMSTCDSVKTVLSGAVFTLINASAQPADSSILISEVGEEEVKKDSQYLHVICSWTFGCGSRTLACNDDATRLSLAKSLILGLMLLAILKGTVNVVSQHVAKAFKDSYRVQTRTELFDHLLAQDLEEFEKQTTRVMAHKASPVVMDSMPNMVTNMVRTVTELLTLLWLQFTAWAVKEASELSLIFLYSMLGLISPLMTFMYATAVPAFQVAAQAYLSCPAATQHDAVLCCPYAQAYQSALHLRSTASGKQAQGSQRRERGLENVANRVVGEACEMIKVDSCLNQSKKQT